MARLASRNPPGVKASPAEVRLNNGSSSSLRSCATCIEMPASETPNSAAAACTEPNRTTAEKARSCAGVTKSAYF